MSIVIYLNLTGASNIHKSSFFPQHIFTDACSCMGCCSCRAVAELHRDIREVLGGGSFDLDFDGWNDRNSRLGCKGRNGKE